MFKIPVILVKLTHMLMVYTSRFWLFWVWSVWLTIFFTNITCLSRREASQEHNVTTAEFKGFHVFPDRLQLKPHAVATCEKNESTLLETPVGAPHRCDPLVS